MLSEALSIPATYGVVTAGEFVNKGVPMIRGGDIKGGAIGTESPHITIEKSQEYSRTILMVNDVVIALVGYPGETALVTDEFVGSNISRAVGLIRIKNKIEPRFLVHYLNSDNGRRNFLTPSAGSAQIVVNLNDLNKLKIPVPSLDEQLKIANTLAVMDADIRSIEKHLIKTRAIKQGMMQQLLTGKIRLVKPQDLADASAAS